MIVIIMPTAQSSQAMWEMYSDRKGVILVAPKTPRAMAAIQTSMDNRSLIKPRNTDTIIDTKIMTNIKTSKSIGEKLSIKMQYFHHRKHYVYPLIAPLRTFTH